MKPRCCIFTSASLEMFDFFSSNCGIDINSSRRRRFVFTKKKLSNFFSSDKTKILTTKRKKDANRANLSSLECWNLEVKRVSEEKSTYHCADRRKVNIVLWIPFWELFQCYETILESSKNALRFFHSLPFGFGQWACKW